MSLKLFSIGAEWSIPLFHPDALNVLAQIERERGPTPVGAMPPSRRRHAAAIYESYWR